MWFRKGIWLNLNQWSKEKGLLRGAGFSRKGFFAPKKLMRKMCALYVLWTGLCPDVTLRAACNRLDIHPGDEHNRKHCRARGDIRLEKRLWETVFLGNNKLFKPPSIGFSYEAAVEITLTENLGDRSPNFIIDNPCLHAHVSKIVPKHVICWYMASPYKFAWKEIWISEQRNNNFYKSSS